jgi:hypothetical protein
MSSPFKMKCWPGFSANGKTKNSPSGKKDSKGKPKRVNACKEIK